MTKVFNTIQELWDYCSICPLCQKERNMMVSVGPDTDFTYSSFQKFKSDLKLECIIINDGFYYSEFNIDCVNNTFDVLVERSEDIPDPEYLSKLLAKPFLYLYLQSGCKKCGHASSYSADMEFHLSTWEIDNIRLEREIFILVKEEKYFNIDIFYDENYMTVASGPSHLERRGIKLPLFDLDFSNQAKLVDKIKTLILFS